MYGDDKHRVEIVAGETVLYAGGIKLDVAVRARVTPLSASEGAGATTILTSNKRFEEWGPILGDEVMTAVILFGISYVRYEGGDSSFLGPLLVVGGVAAGVGAALGVAADAAWRLRPSLCRVSPWKNDFLVLRRQRVAEPGPIWTGRQDNGSRGPAADA